MIEIPQHKNILLQILKDIYSDTSISPSLGFKGGTAAYMFYDLPRFSVDLDFDLLNESKTEDIFKKIKNIIENYGQVKEFQKKRFSLFFLLSYQDRAQNIKVEINRRLFKSKYTIKTYLGISMLVMKRADMFAHKMVAMYERAGKSNRDIYDVWFFSKNGWPINKQIVEERTQLTFKEFLETSITSLETKKHNILHGIGELLDQKQKYWVKNNLKKDVLFLLKIMLENEKQ